MVLGGDLGGGGRRIREFRAGERRTATVLLSYGRNGPSDRGNGKRRGVTGGDDRQYGRTSDGGSAVGFRFVL